jgi:hypothetical protein
MGAGATAVGFGAAGLLVVPVRIVPSVDPVDPVSDPVADVDRDPEPDADEDPEPDSDSDPEFDPAPASDDPDWASPIGAPDNVVSAATILTAHARVAS